MRPLGTVHHPVALQRSLVGIENSGPSFLPPPLLRGGGMTIPPGRRGRHGESEAALGAGSLPVSFLEVSRLGARACGFRDFWGFLFFNEGSLLGMVRKHIQQAMAEVNGAHPTKAGQSLWFWIPEGTPSAKYAPQESPTGWKKKFTTVYAGFQLV